MHGMDASVFVRMSLNAPNETEERYIHEKSVFSNLTKLQSVIWLKSSFNTVYFNQQRFPVSLEHLDALF